jgi:hypothetical protein
MVRLNRVKRRRWATVTDDRAGPVAAAVAEPMPKHPHAGDFIGPCLRGDCSQITSDPSAFGEQLRVCGQRDPQAGPYEIGLETRRKCRLGRDSGEVGLPIDFRDVGEKRRLDVRLGRGAVSPERVNAASAPVIVMLVRDETGECQAGPLAGDKSSGAVANTCRFEAGRKTPMLF